MKNWVNQNVNVKALELMKRKGVIHSSLIRPIAKLIVPTNESKFRLYNDPDSGNQNNYIMKREKTTLYGVKIVFECRGKVFTLRGDVLKMTTDYKLKTKDSPDPKLIIKFMDEKRFDIHARGKSLRDRNLGKNYFNKRALLASGIKNQREPFCFRKLLLISVISYLWYSKKSKLERIRTDLIMQILL